MTESQQPNDAKINSTNYEELVEGDPRDIRDLDQNTDALIKTMFPEDEAAPGVITDVFTTIAVNAGINVKITDEGGSNMLPRSEDTSYNGEAEIIINGFGKDTKSYFRLDNKASDYFNNRFATA